MLFDVLFMFMLFSIDALLHHTPISSFQSSGRSAMNDSIMLMHAVSCNTLSSTPRERKCASSPMKVMLSPTTTFGIPYVYAGCGSISFNYFKKSLGVRSHELEVCAVVFEIVNAARN